MSNTAHETQPSGDAGGDSGLSVACYYADFEPGESATVTISAPGFKSTTVTVTYQAQPSSGACCPVFSPGKVALVPQ